MSQKTDAPKINWNVDFPPDSPLIANPALAQGLAIPTEHVRRMEEAQRVFSIHSEQQVAYAQAIRDASLTFGVQSCWLGIGGWLFARGYRYADPVQSLASGFTANKQICRMATPLALLGLTIFSVTAFQVPSDARLLMDARHAWRLEEEQKALALEARAKAYLEGKAFAERIKADEDKAFEASMAALPKTQ